MKCFVCWNDLDWNNYSMPLDIKDRWEMCMMLLHSITYIYFILCADCYKSKQKVMKICTFNLDKLRVSQLAHLFEMHCKKHIKENVCIWQNDFSKAKHLNFLYIFYSESVQHIGYNASLLYNFTWTVIYYCEKTILKICLSSTYNEWTNKKLYVLYIFGSMLVECKDIIE